MGISPSTPVGSSTCGGFFISIISQVYLLTLPITMISSMMGVEVIDPDGWRGRRSQDYSIMMGLTEFMSRLSESTIREV